PQVQRLGFDDILDWLADKANAIPGFRMFTIVLGVNPVNMSRVDRSAANILRAVVEFIPGGNLITRALDTYGVFDKVGKWIEGQIETLGMVGSAFKDAISDFIDSLGWRDLFRPGSVWRRAKRIFTDPIDKLIDFARGFIGGILDFLREAALRPLAKLAEGTRAYDLLKAVLGKDPITGDPVEQSADVLIGGFMKLIGQEEVWENIKKGNAVARAFAWFKGVLGGVLAFVSAVPGMIISTIKSITLTDFLPITNLFAKVGRAFAGFVGSFLSWGIDQVLGLLQIIFEVVIPRAVPYIKKAAGAFKTIIRDPIRFVGNLVRAGVQGFRQFSGRFLVHLRKSLVEWLTGSMRGANIYVPQGLSIPEIVKFALSVLGLTWENIRQKLVAAVGETAVSAMEATFGVVKTLVTQGPAAAWEQIKEGIGNLQQMVMGQIMTYVRNQIVVQTVQKLVTSLNPAGAFIQAVIAIYNTVMFFIERLRQIGQVVASFIDSISAIASGAVGAAANRVETTMAGLLTLVISFLARLAGLGKVSDEVVKVVKRIRDPIDKGLDRVVAWIVAQARKLGRYVAQAGVPQDPASRLRLAAQAATAVLNRFRGRPVGVAVLRPLLPVIVTRYGLTELVPFEREGRWWVRATINPKVENPSEAQPEGAAGAAAAGTRKPIRRIMTVNMGPVSHSLTTVVTAGSTQVTMDGGSLQAKLGALIEAVKDPKSNVRKKESVSNKLAAINTRLADYNVLLSAYARSLGEQHTARAPTEEFIRDYKATLVAEIVGLATNYGFTGLVVKTFIPSPLPNERHLPEPVKSEIRARLYERGSAWTTERATVVRTDTARIDKEIQDTIVKPRDAGNKAAAQAAMVGMKARGLVLEGATIDDFVAKASYVTPNLGLYAVDHDPSLAEHWQKGGGNATSDAVRHSVVEGKSYARLSLVTRRYNSQKGSYSLDGEASFFKKHAFILVPFTSAGGKDINGTPNSVDLVTIDSHSLTYPDGTPYLPI
ncbi:MAG TPA: hypothetical protein VFT45_15400, partial [Longimicrobium sp.]|nr:hypothetical protein [Longimicrobium sp.]